MHSPRAHLSEDDEEGDATDADTANRKKRKADQMEKPSHLHGASASTAAPAASPSGNAPALRAQEMHFLSQLRDSLREFNLKPAMFSEPADRSCNSAM
jgi:hypothetical protein